jgi:hypothetical protein
VAWASPVVVQAEQPEQQPSAPQPPAQKQKQPQVKAKSQKILDGSSDLLMFYLQSSHHSLR